MELCEPAKIAAAAIEGNDPCWYCKEKWNEKTNDEEAVYNTDDSERETSVPENDEHNCASKLGKNLKNQPTFWITCPHSRKPTEVFTAAHHCIPGNASLKKATGLHKFMRGGKAPLNLATDIGYSVNHANNGIWLPGNYGVRKDVNKYKKGWGSFAAPFKNEYAARAMREAGVQFHDAHPKYSKNVLKTLQVLADSIPKPTDKCPICKKKLDKTRPPYGLVGRIDFVSDTHANLLSNLTKTKGKKYVSNGYFTSTRVKTFFKVVKVKDW